jgi:hypothetical protein
MSAMTKARGEQYPASEPALRTRRKRSISSDPNEAFLRAFADALRDILHTEVRGSV